jgi:hypothetical protein
MLATALVSAAIVGGLIFPQGGNSGPLEPIYFEQDVEGTFSNQTYSITLSNLPAHTAVWVGFNLETIGNWQGDARGDIWKLDDGNPSSPLVTATFSNDPAFTQSFPTSYPNGNDPAQDLAITATPYQNALYEDAGLYPHTGSSLTLNFTGVANLDWTLSNLTVSMYPTPEPSAMVLCGPALAVILFRAARRRCR